MNQLQELYHGSTILHVYLIPPPPHTYRYPAGPVVHSVLPTCRSHQVTNPPPPSPGEAR